MSKKSIFTASALVVLMVGVVMLAFYIHHRARENALYHQKDFVKIVEGSGEENFRDLEGKKVSLDAYIGKPFVLLVWASWCPSCGDQISLVARIAGEYSLPVLALNRGETMVLANDYLNFVHKPQGPIYIIDQGDKAFGIMKGFAMPELVLYGADAMEAYHSRGTLTEEEMRTEFNKIKPK